jgi:hypothetical protein
VGENQKVVRVGLDGIGCVKGSLVKKVKVFDPVNNCDGLDPLHTSVHI